VTPGPHTVVVAIGGRIDRDDAVALGARIRELLAGRSATLLVCDLGSLVDPDAATVDAICRIKVVAIRLGCRLQLRAAPPPLVELLDLVGLSDVLPVRAPQSSG
jgi:anti-anti-sigma regulatory factor